MVAGRHSVFGEGLLPGGAKPVCYLESDGGQYIDTYITQADDLVITATFQVITVSDWGTIFGCGYLDNPMYNILGRIYGTQINNFNPWFANDTYSQCQIPISSSSFNTVTVAAGGATKDGITYAISSVSGRLRNYTIYLFSANYGNSPWRSLPCRISAFSVRKADELILDLIPVRVKQDGFMYDLVTKQLFANAGSGAFVVGPDKRGGF